MLFMKASKNPSIDSIIIIIGRYPIIVPRQADAIGLRISFWYCFRYRYRVVSRYDIRLYSPMFLPMKAHNPIISPTKKWRLIDGFSMSRDMAKMVAMYAVISNALKDS